MFGRKKSASSGRDAAVSTGAESTGPTGQGPHNRSSVEDLAAYYSKLGCGHIDLGALVIGVPKGRDLNVALDPNGNPEFHVVTAVSRVIPRVFAAPRSAGQWRGLVTSMTEQLENQGADVSIHDGPWEREIVAQMPGAVFRAIGVDGDRWTAEVRIMATPDNAEKAAEEGREVFRNLLIHRGDGPMPAREQLALTIPDEIQKALEKARAQAAAQQQSQAYQQQMAAGTSAGASTGSGGAQAGAARTQASPEPAQETPGRTSEPETAEGTGPRQDSPRPRRGSSAMDRIRGDDDL